MNRPFDFDSRLSSWLDEQAVPGAPDGLLGQVVERASHTRRRPAWATLERWISMETRAQLGAVPRTAVILVILAVLLAVLSAIALGQQPSPKLPPPLGLARNGLIAFDDGGDIWVVAPDGTGRRQLTATPEWDVQPVWSQDGTQIAFWSEPDSKQQSTAALKVIDADGTDVRTLAEGLRLSRLNTHPSWSHDGRFLAYSDQSGSIGLEVDRISVVPVAGGPPVELVSPGQDPTWSPDDQWIGYRSGGLTKDVTDEPVGWTLVSMDGSAKRLLVKSTYGSQFDFLFPSWTPDGKRIAYQAGADTNQDVFVATVDGGVVQTISALASGENQPAWSPDGTHLAYMAGPAVVGPWQVVVVAADGSDARVLESPPLGCACGIKWSPDGTHLTVYQDGPVDHEDTGGSMLIIDVSGKEPVQAIPYAGLSNQQVSWQRLAP